MFEEPDNITDVSTYYNAIMYYDKMSIFVKHTQIKKIITKFIVKLNYFV